MTTLSGETLRDEIIDTSLEAFGQENYGQLALDIMANAAKASTIRIIRERGIFKARFGGGPYHFDGDHEDIHDPIFKGDTSAVSWRDIRLATLDRLDPETVLFDYDFHPAKGRPYGWRTPYATLTPQAWTKDGLARFMTRPGAGYHPSYPTLADHHLTGAIGRALDVMSLVSGVKTDVDPSDTAVDGALVDYDAFRIDTLKAKGVTKDTRRHMHDALRLSVMREILTGRTPGSDYEVVVEGNTRTTGTGFSTEIKIDKISLASLKEYAQRTTSGPLAEAIYDLPD